MANSTYSFAIKGVGLDEEKTLSVQILNDRTGTVLGALVFSGADAVKEFLVTMRGLAAVVFPDPQDSAEEKITPAVLWSAKYSDGSEDR